MLLRHGIDVFFCSTAVPGFCATPIQRILGTNHGHIDIDVSFRSECLRQCGVPLSSLVSSGDSDAFELFSLDTLATHRLRTAVFRRGARRRTFLRPRRAIATGQVPSRTETRRGGARWRTRRTAGSRTSTEPSLVSAHALCSWTRARWRPPSAGDGRIESGEGTVARGRGTCFVLGSGGVPQPHDAVVTATRPDADIGPFRWGPRFCVSQFRVSVSFVVRGAIAGRGADAASSEVATTRLSAPWAHTSARARARGTLRRMTTDTWLTCCAQ